MNVCSSSSDCRCAEQGRYWSWYRSSVMSDDPQNKELSPGYLPAPDDTSGISELESASVFIAYNRCATRSLTSSSMRTDGDAILPVGTSLSESAQPSSAIFAIL